MHDKQKIMPDLKLKLGLLQLDDMIAERQLKWIHNLAEMPEDRLKRQALFFWIGENSGKPKGQRASGLAVRQGCWLLLEEIRKLTTLRSPEWRAQWPKLMADTQWFN